MKKTAIKIACLALAAAIMLPCALAVSSPLEVQYADVPQTSKAHYDDIYQAKETGLMLGTTPDGKTFGFGDEILRCDFMIILSRLFGWSLIRPATPSFSDVPQKGYYYTHVETAKALGVIDGTPAFEPMRAITRGEMAVMLVKALGYGDLAPFAASLGQRFTDVNDDIAGFIALAYDVGLTRGVSDTLFAPDATATREQTASMIMRVYRRLNGTIDFLHGFYAFSSYSQRDLATKMDGVSLGWSRLKMDTSGAWINTSSTGGNEWSIPSSYESITTYLDNSGIPAHLNVFMDTTSAFTLADGTKVSELKHLLSSEENIKAGVKCILSEVTRPYSAIGRSPYTGVTIDFEGLKSPEKEGFNLFLTLLSEGLKEKNLSLYVCVQPPVFNEAYYDGFDFATIGRLADKVILMAHDYGARSLAGLEGTSSWHTRSAPTPFSKVYYSLKAITDEQTGVADKSKIALAISFSNMGWELDSVGRLKSGMPVTPSVATLNERLLSGSAVLGYNETYRNSYVQYQHLGKNYFVWYESPQAVNEKIKLAMLLGVTGISLWRLGEIPSYPGSYDAYSVILNYR